MSLSKRLREAARELATSIWAVLLENGTVKTLHRPLAVDQRIEEWLQDNALLAQQVEWVSVKDRLPEEGQYCFVAHANSGYVTKDCYSIHCKGGWELDESGEITHWMKWYPALPTPPTEDA